jgi:hypothetical protein
MTLGAIYCAKALEIGWNVDIKRNNAMFVVVLGLKKIGTIVGTIDFHYIVCNAIGVHLWECGYGQ